MNPEYREVEGRSPQEGGVVIVPNVTEGPRATVRAIVFDLGEAPAIGEAMLRAEMRAREGGPFVPAYLELDRQAIAAYYERRGYLNRTLELSASFHDALTEVVQGLVDAARPRPRRAVQPREAARVEPEDAGLAARGRRRRLDARAESAQRLRDERDGLLDRVRIDDVRAELRRERQPRRVAHARQDALRARRLVHPEERGLGPVRFDDGGGAVRPLRMAS
jgi:hypothetical protein